MKKIAYFLTFLLGLIMWKTLGCPKWVFFERNTIGLCLITYHADTFIESVNLINLYYKFFLVVFIIDFRSEFLDF